LEYDAVCPQCGGEVFDAGDAFKALKVNDAKAWNELKPLFESGYRFSSDFGSPFAEPSNLHRSYSHQITHKIANLGYLLPNLHWWQVLGY
jgi:hypothetical protein